jgi:hypothetical protein
MFDGIVDIAALSSDGNASTRYLYLEGICKGSREGVR